MQLPSIYTPEGSFTYLLVIVALTLAAAIAYLVLFTNAALPA